METFTIEKFRFESLKNGEFTLVVPHIISIVEHFPVISKVSRRVEEVKSFLPELDKIEAQERKWHEAQLLNDAEQTRDVCVNTIIRTERTYNRVSLPEYAEASKKLTAFFDKHKRDIAADTNIAETKRIYKLAEDIERTPGMIEVLATFSLIPVYEAMKNANKQFDDLWQRRNMEIGESEHVDSRLIRTNCVKAINSLYNGIEYWAAEEKTPEWASLIRVLSNLGSYYRQQIKARNTRRKEKNQSENEPLIQPQQDITYYSS